MVYISRHRNTEWTYERSRVLEWKAAQMEEKRNQKRNLKIKKVGEERRYLQEREIALPWQKSGTTRLLRRGDPPFPIRSLRVGPGHQDPVKVEDVGDVYKDLLRLSGQQDGFTATYCYPMKLVLFVQCVPPNLQVCFFV